MSTTAESASPAETNKAVVQEFYRLVYEERKPDAAARLVSRDCRQHGPALADGRDAYVASLADLLGTYPFLQMSVKRTVAEGDLVVVHGHLVPEPGDRGRSSMEILRLDAGKITERWHVVEDVPAKAANRNTMF